MARAKCQNLGCERYNEWWQLRKHPDDYARGVTCPDCGTTNVEVEYDEREPRAPARRGERETRPETGGTGGAGAAVADVFFALSHPDAPREVRTEAVRQGAGFLGGAINRWLDHRERNMERNREAARSAELTRNEQYPECGDCGYQFDDTEIIASTRSVKCPECHTVWDVTMKEAPIDASPPVG